MLLVLTSRSTSVFWEGRQTTSLFSSYCINACFTSLYYVTREVRYQLVTVQLPAVSVARVAILASDYLIVFGASPMDNSVNFCNCFGFLYLYYSVSRNPNFEVACLRFLDFIRHRPFSWFIMKSYRLADLQMRIQWIDFNCVELRADWAPCCWQHTMPVMI